MRVGVIIKQGLLFLVPLLAVGCSYIFESTDEDRVAGILPRLVSEDAGDVKAARSELSGILPKGSSAVTTCALEAETPLRVLCLQMLPTVGVLPVEPTVKALLTGFNSPDFAVQRAALFAAPGLPAVSAKVLPSIIQLLDSPSSELRSVALVSLGYFGERGASALPAVKKYLDAPDPLVRIQAIATTARIGNREAKKALGRSLQFLNSSLKSDDPSVRAAAINALGQLGWTARSSVGTISDYVKVAESDAERVQAALALWRIGTPQARKSAEQIIAKARKSSDPVVLSAVAAFDAVSAKPAK